MAETFSMEAMTRAGCTSRRGIRYWEELGLLGEVERSDGDTRRYSLEQIDRAKIIAAASFGGFALSQIKEMVESYDQEVYEAIMGRLYEQSRAIVRLIEQLPKAKKAMLKNYDL